ncbi:sec-independent translocase [Paracoccaceae bacterium]
MEFSWSEMLVVGIAALIIIGPKDLPGMFRELGRISAKLRAMGREFSRAMEAAAKESGVKDVADDLRKVTSPKAMGLDAVKSATDKFEKWDPLKNAAKPSKPLTPAPMPPTPVAAQATPQILAPEAAPPVAVEAAPVGPSTAALYEKKAARKAVLDEAAAKLRAIEVPTAEVADAAPAAKAPGRRRKKAAASDGEDA